jgi:hypothetical protein
LVSIPEEEEDKFFKINNLQKELAFDHSNMIKHYPQTEIKEETPF